MKLIKDWKYSINENIVCGFIDGCSTLECREFEFSNNGDTITQNFVKESFCTDNTDCETNIPIEECNEPNYEISEGYCMFNVFNRQ